MITLAAMLKLTPKDVVERGLKQCRVEIKDVLLKKDRKGEHKYCSGMVRATDVGRAVTIKYYDPDKKDPLQCPIWAHCTCGYHTYTVETANARKGSSTVVLSNGRNPVIRNPQNIPHFCKHLVAFAKATMKLPPKNEQLDLFGKDKFKNQKPVKPTMTQPKPAKPTPKAPGPKPLSAPKPMTGPKPVPMTGPKRPAKP